MSETTNAVLCPRCQVDSYTPYGGMAKPGFAPFPALSRSDNLTYVCDQCGTDEAMRDFARERCVPPAEWPVVVRKGEEWKL